MSDFDRSRLVELLGRLGDGNDETVLTAARDASRLVMESGRGWDDLIAADGVSAAAVSQSSTPADKSGDAKIIDRLLARKDISDTLRSDLQDFRRSIAEGTFDKMDAEYVRALAKRLGA
jgi:hypothetical protein